MTSGLWWVYALVAGALASTGAGVGAALFTANDLGNARSVAVCLAADGLSTASPELRFAQHIYYACTADNRWLEAFTALAGAVGVLVAAWLLMILGGLAVRWRLRPTRVAGVPADAANPLTDRFAVLCDREGLVGRRRPRLVIAPPATGVTEAFTTALPGARPWVVVPHSFSFADGPVFDAVAVHELSHVRSRDVMWASAVWWSGWLAVPALVIALAPVLTTDVAWELYGVSLALAVVSALSILLLRAALLRRRETVADRHVIEMTEDPTTLAAFLRAAPAPARGRRFGIAVLRRAFATHPTAAERLAAGTTEASPGYGGFLFSAVVGVVTMRTYHGVEAVLSGLIGNVDGFTRLSETVSLLVAFLLWAVVMVPPWTRRSTLPVPRWATAWTGAVSGLVAGYCTEPPGTMQITLRSHGSNVVLLGVGLTAFAFMGVVLTASAAASFATPAPGRNRHRLGVVGAYVAAAATMTASVTAVVDTAGANVAFKQTTTALDVLVQGGSTQPWRILVPVILTGLLLLALRVRRSRTGPMVVIAVTAITGGTGASLSWLLRAPDDLTVGLSTVMVHERWWICGLAGIATTITLLLAGRHHPTGSAAVLDAVLGGLITTTLAGVIQYATIQIVDPAKDSILFEQSLQYPGWYFFIALTLALPVTLAALRMPTRRTVRHGFGAWTGVGAAALTVLLAFAVLNGNFSLVTGTRHEYDTARSLVMANEIPPPPTMPAVGRDHGRPLDDTAANTALDLVPALLPPTATRTHSPPSATASHVSVRPRSCDDAFDRVIAAETAAHTTDLSREYIFPIDGIPLGVTVDVSITSYPTPWEDLSTVDDLARECTRFRVPDPGADDGYTDKSTTLQPPPLTSYETSALAFTEHAKVSGMTIGIPARLCVALVGHNEISVTVSWVHGRTPPPQDTVTRLNQLATDTLRTITDNL